MAFEVLATVGLLGAGFSFGVNDVGGSAPICGAFWVLDGERPVSVAFFSEKMRFARRFSRKSYARVQQNCIYDNLVFFEIIYHP